MSVDSELEDFTLSFSLDDDFDDYDDSYVPEDSDFEPKMTSDFDDDTPRAAYLCASLFSIRDYFRSVLLD